MWNDECVLSFRILHSAFIILTLAVVPPIVTIESLHYSYPPWPADSAPVPVLRGVDLEVEEGEFLALTGATASGKSTLLMALNGLVPQATGGRIKGEVRVDGLNPRRTPVAEMARRVGLVFQDPETQLFNLSVEDEVAFGLENLGLPPREIRERVDWALGALGLSDCRGRSPFQLSGGQQRRLAIAAILAMTPGVLALDEPTAGLDPSGKRELMRALQDLRRRKDTTVVMAEQDGEVVAEFADRVAVLHDGQIALVDTPERVFRQADLLRAAGLRPPQVVEIAAGLNAGLGTHFFFTRLEEAVQALATTADDRRPTADSATPRSAVSGLPSHPPFTNGPGLEACELWFAYDGGPQVLRGISVKISRGDFVAMVGQNGSGKTTLAKQFIGLLRPTRGAVRVLGEEVRDRPVSELAHTVGFVFQNPDHQIFSGTVREEVSFGLRQMGLALSETQARVEEALARFRLEPVAELPPATLSYGLRRKVTVAAAYAMRPPIWILDEPTTGLDWASARELLDLLVGLRREEGATILLITHDLRLAAENAPRCLVLHQGRVLAEGETRAVFGQAEAYQAAGLELPPAAELSRRLGLPDLALTAAEFCDLYLQGSPTSAKEAE